MFGFWLKTLVDSPRLEFIPQKHRDQIFGRQNPTRKSHHFRTLHFRPIHPNFGNWHFEHFRYVQHFDVKSPPLHMNGFEKNLRRFSGKQLKTALSVFNLRRVNQPDEELHTVRQE